MRFVFLIFTAMFVTVSSAELTIFDVQRNLPLANDEKVYHDYYVDGGSESGLKTGMTLTVQRRLPLYDFYRARPVADLWTKIARVKVIDVQEGVSVVRLREEISREDVPLSDDNFIMMGDHLDLGHLVAEVEAPAPVVNAVPVATPAPAAPVEVKSAAKPTGQIVVNSVAITAEDAKIAEPVPSAAAKPTVK